MDKKEKVVCEEEEGMVVTWDGEAEYNCTRRGNPARHAHYTNSGKK
jgi:hypothetical protein